MSVWNAHGRETVQVLKDIASGASSAASAMATLSSLGQPAASAGAAGGGKATQSQAAREAAAVFAQTRTASEAYEAQVAKLGGMLQSGAVNQDTYNRGLAQAKDKLDDANRGAATFTVSWETMARVVTTQLIVRALTLSATL